MMFRRQRQLALGCGLVVALLAATTAIAAAQQATTLQLVQQNNSGISGTATFTPSGGGLTVDLKVTGAGAGPQPAHIHEGTCTQLNPTPQYTLASVTNGSSTTTIQTTLQSLAATPHAVHMHKSADELSVYVACADINPSTLPRTGEADSSTWHIFAAVGLSLAGVGLLLRRRSAKPVGTL
jgi:LPXTG-motif cell wall-anchored protein